MLLALVLLNALSTSHLSLGVPLTSAEEGRHSHVEAADRNDFNHHQNQHHDSADHSHETAYPPLAAGLQREPSAREPRTHYRRAALSAPVFRFDRPPKPAFA